MNTETIEISKVIQKTPCDRTKPELDKIIPFLSTRSELLNNLSSEVLFELIKHCRHLQCKKNDVIIKQGAIGDCFYIILTGHTSVYIDAAKNDDTLEEGAHSDKRSELDTFFDELDTMLGVKPKSKDVTEKETEQYERCSLGKFIMIIESGKSFGEVALLSENAERNASVVADMDDMELLVVDKELYNRTVKDKQMAEYKDKRNFISSHPLFRQWGSRMQRLLEMSMTKHTYSFDNIIAKQGQPYDGLYFVISGQAKLLVDTGRHVSQYPRLMTCPNTARHKHLARTMVHIKRNFGYIEAEKMVNQKHIEMAFLTSGDVFGDLETVTQMPTYMGTLQCISQAVVLHINAKNFDRLVVKKNPRTQELFRDMTFQRFADILHLKTSQPVPLLQAVYDKFVHGEESVDPATKAKPKDKSDKDIRTAHLLQLYTEGKMQLLESCVPDSVYFRYKSIERRKQSLSARERILKEQRDNSVNGKLRTLHETRKKALSGNGRRARSRRELADVTLEDFIASRKVIGKYTEYGSREDEGDAAAQPHHARPGSVSSLSTRTPLSRPLSAKPSVHINETPTFFAENKTHSPRQSHSTSRAASNDYLSSKIASTDHSNSSSRDVHDAEHLVVPHSANQNTQMSPISATIRPLSAAVQSSDRPLSSVQSSDRISTNQSLLLDEDVLKDALGDNSLVAFFNVMEAIGRRREMNKYTSRPASAPNLIYTKGADSEAPPSEAEDSSYFDSESSNEVLSSLEQKVLNFHRKLISTSGQEKARVTQLKRCNIQRLNPPVAGGTVFVRVRPCSSIPSDDSITTDDHSHVRRYILPKLKSY